MDCIFCKIVKREVPNYTVYEDDAVLAFLDIHPCCKGHTVVILKKHTERLSELVAEEWISLTDGMRKSLDKIETILRPEGVNIGINDGAAAGQAVPHIHWHIFPRWAHDGGSSVHGIINKDEEIDVQTVARLFKK